jgi:hypothetical protein
MNFGDALHHLKNGHRVARSGWNGKGMYLFQHEGYEFPVKRNSPLNQEHPEGSMVAMLPFIVMRTVDGSCVPWLCSQTDALAVDWVNIDQSGHVDVGQIGHRPSFLGQG